MVTLFLKKRSEKKKKKKEILVGGIPFMFIMI